MYISKKSTRHRFAAVSIDYVFDEEGVDSFAAGEKRARRGRKNVTVEVGAL